MVIYSLCVMVLGARKVDTQDKQKSRCTCVKTQGRNPYCRTHGDQKYREGAAIP